MEEIKDKDLVKEQEKTELLNNRENEVDPATLPIENSKNEKKDQPIPEIKFSELPSLVNFKGTYKLNIEDIGSFKGCQLKWKGYNCTIKEISKGNIQFKPQHIGEVKIILKVDKGIDNKVSQVVLTAANSFTPIKRLTDDVKIEVFDSIEFLLQAAGRSSIITQKETAFLPKLYYVHTGSEGGIFNYKIFAVRSELGRFKSIIDK